MAIQHVNRKGDTYFLHQGKTKTGKPKYYFSKKKDGVLADTIPEGYEIYENPNAQVFLRKIEPKIITDEEIAIVENGVRDSSNASKFIIDVKNNSIIVHLSDRSGESIVSPFGFPVPSSLVADLEKSSMYSPMMKFTLINEEKRSFMVERWCFKGSIDDWFPLTGSGDLQKLVEKYAPHLGRESFFELF